MAELSKAKNPNLFLSENKKNQTGKLRFKLADFGLSFNQSTEGLRGFGDNMYLAPELIKSNSFAEKIDFAKCDIFALGTTVLKFILDRVIVEEKEKVNFLKMAKSGDFEFLKNLIFENIDQKILKMIPKMMEQDPKHRISSVQILSLLELPIPFITPKEIQNVKSELPMASFNMRNPNKVRHPSFLSKRSGSFLSTSDELEQDSPFGSLETFAFPTLDNSKPASTDAQMPFDVSSDICSTLKSVKKSLFSNESKSSCMDFLIGKKTRKSSTFMYSKENKLKHTKSIGKSSKPSASKILLDLDLPFKATPKPSSNPLSFDLSLNMNDCIRPFA